MFTRTRIAVALTTIFIISLMAAPAFAQESPTPPGQLTRNGIFGTVVAVGDDYVIVSTKFGNVTVDVDGDTRIKSARAGAISLGDIQVGDRAAIHLNRSPLSASASALPTPTPTPPPSTTTPGATPTPTPASPTVDVTPTPTPASPTVDVTPTPTPASPTVDATPTPTPASPTIDATPTPSPAALTLDVTPEPTPDPEDSFRDVTARSIHIIPSKATRSHARTVVTGKCNAPEHARGKMRVLDEDGNVIEFDCSAGETTGEGDEVILLTRGQGKGRPDEVRGSADPNAISARLDNLGRLANDERKALLAELKAERNEQRETRLANLESRAPDHAKGKVQQARARRSGGGDGDSPDRGNADNRGGNSGNRSGGGNSGNRGGGNPNS